MGGEIGVESTVGTGSTFWVKLPRSSSPLARFQETGIHANRLQRFSKAPFSTSRDNLANLALIEYLFAQRPQLKLLAAMQGGLGSNWRGNTSLISFCSICICRTSWRRSPRLLEGRPRPPAISPWPC
jgi:hypothetical protein